MTQIHAQFFSGETTLFSIQGNDLELDDGPQPHFIPDFGPVLSSDLLSTYCWLAMNTISLI
jgi:hypothetical protein